jgi:hypothetical protein
MACGIVDWWWIRPELNWTDFKLESPGWMTEFPHKQTMADVKGGEEDESGERFLFVASNGACFLGTKVITQEHPALSLGSRVIKFTRNILTKHKKRFCKLQGCSL